MSAGHFVGYLVSLDGPIGEVVHGTLPTGEPWGSYGHTDGPYPTEGSADIRRRNVQWVAHTFGGETPANCAACFARELVTWLRSTGVAAMTCPTAREDRLTVWWTADLSDLRDLRDEVRCFVAGWEACRRVSDAERDAEQG